MLRIFKDERTTAYHELKHVKFLFDTDAEFSLCILESLRRQYNISIKIRCFSILKIRNNIIDK